MTIEVGYWNLRGKVGPMRLLAAYTGQAVNWVHYDIAQYETTWKQEKSKNEAGFDFPNLPWLKDGDLKITQSMAILKHMARSHNLTNENDAGSLAVSDMIEQQIIDTKDVWNKFNYSTRSGDSRSDEEFKTETLLPTLKQWDAFLGDKEWLNGNSLSYLDFLFWEFLDCLSLVFPEAIKQSQAVFAFYKRFANLPQILAYLESDNFQVLPFAGPWAKYGNDGTLKRKEKLYL